MNDQITFVAASIAFYATISIFPLALLALVIAATIGGPAFSDWLVEVSAGILAPDVMDIILASLESVPTMGGASIVGVVFLLWGSLRVFRGLDIAFSLVFGEGEVPSFLRNVLNAGIVLGAIGVGFGAMFMVGAVVRVLDPAGITTHLSVVLVFLALGLLFLPMFYVFPGVDQRLIHVIPGAMLAAAGWTLLGQLFGIYAANAGTFALFGIIGGFLLLMMWLYFGAILLMIGAVLNAALAGRLQLAEEEVNEERPRGPATHLTDERDA